MSETWAKIECEFMVSDRLLSLPLGARWLYIELWAYAHKEQRQTIRRPKNSWLASHFGLLRHPVADYLQALDDAELIVLTDTTIELPGLREKHLRYKYKDVPAPDRRPYAGDKPKGPPPKKASKKKKVAAPKKGEVATKKKAATKKKPAKKKSASRDAEHEKPGTVAKRLVDFFFETYLKKRGARYRVVGQRDMNIFKTLLQVDGEAIIRAAIVKFLSLNGDSYLQQNGYSVVAFKSRYQGLVQEVEREGGRAPISGGGERLRGTK